MSQNRSLLNQMVGYHHACIAYDQYQFDEYYEFLHEAEEFAAAATVYNEERNELLANAAHRYQLLIDWTTARLKLNVAFLNKAKVWFNFYADIAGRFGIGTQAYTTETGRPHIGVSELSLQDAYFLQLILLHEMQHATDYVNYDGLKMPLGERELRARISICQGLYPLFGEYPRLYRDAVLDETYWYVIFFHTAASEVLKQNYFDLLEEAARDRLLNPEVGVVFTPLVIRALGKELTREHIQISPRLRYVIESSDGQLKLSPLPLEGQEESVEEAIELLEELMVEDVAAQPSSAHVKDISPDDLDILTLDFSRDVPTTKNKVTDWQPYEETYQKLKQKASVVIKRDQRAFENIHVKLGLITGSGIQIEEPLMPQAMQMALDVDSETYKQLDSLEIPEAQLETDIDGVTQTEAIPVQLEPLQSKVSQRHNVDGNTESAGEEMVSNLSEYIKEKGGR